MHKEAIIVDLQGNFTDVTLVSDDVIGVTEIMDNDTIVAYQIAVKVDKPLHMPKWDFEAQQWVEGKQVDLELELNAVKDAKIKELNQACNEKIIQGFTSLTTIASTGKQHTYGCDDNDQKNFTGKLAQLNANPLKTDWYFKTEDTQEMVLHTREEFVEICNEAIAHIETNISQCLVLKNSVRNAKSIEEVQLIN